MKKHLSTGIHQSHGSKFSPPVFPPEAGGADKLLHFTKKSISGVGKGIHSLTQLIFSFLCLFVMIAVLVGPLVYLGINYEIGQHDERSNRNIVFEEGVFFLMDENKTEIESSDLLPGDRITFTHIGNITETKHSSTSCSSSSSGSYYGESNSDSYYGGEDDMECWTDYYTHYVLNASWVMFETSNVNEIYKCHRSACEIIAELVNVDDLLVTIHSVEVIS